MLNKLNWQTVARGDRNATIDQLKEIISKNDGYILNFQMFSDLAISIGIEVSGNRIPDLHQQLQNLLEVSALETEKDALTSAKDCLLFLHVSFIQGKGNLSIEIPEVPG